MRPVLNLAGAFAAGALATYWLGRSLGGRDAGPSRDDAQLRDRVRARIAVLVSRPQAIQVEAKAGLVRVSGFVLASELDALLSRLTQVAGVHKVHNALTPLADPGDFNLAAGKRKRAALQV